MREYQKERDHTRIQKVLHRLQKAGQKLIDCFQRVLKKTGRNRGRRPGILLKHEGALQVSKYQPEAEPDLRGRIGKVDAKKKIRAGG